MFNDKIRGIKHYYFFFESLSFVRKFKMLNMSILTKTFLGNISQYFSGKNAF
jgi:hypothetical protein